MFVEILPIRKLPKSMSILDYAIPKNLEKVIKPGQLVKSPFKKGTVLGLVYNLKNNSQFKNVKPIIEIIDEIPFLPTKYLKLMEWFSDYYHYSLNSTLNLFLPPFPKKSSKKTYNPKIELNKKNIKIIPKLEKTAEQLFCSTNNNYLLFPYNQNYKIQLFIGLIKETIKTNQQILILFPQIEKLKLFTSFLPKELFSKATIITNELFTKKNHYYQTWQEIKNNQKQIIIGTRSAIFLPVKNLKTLILDFSHNSDFKQSEMTPRYQTITIAQELQKITNCKLILSSTSPKIEDYHQAQQKKYQQITLGQRINYKNLEIIDLKDARRREFTYLSPKLIEQIKETLEKKQKVLLIVNKKGLAGSLMCLDCKKIAHCPECKLPLSLNENKQLNCYRCKKEFPVYLKCPNCQSFNLKSYGIGLEQIKLEINQIFSNNPLIKISTLQEFSTNTWQNIGILGIIYLDNFIHLADFNSNFQLYSQILELSYQTKFFNPTSKTLVQTAFPENIVYQNLLNDYQTFYKQEINSRKLFNYPPFSKLIKIFFQDNLEIATKQEAEKIHKILLKLQQNNNFQVSVPYSYHQTKIRNKYRQQISLKLNKKTKVENNIIELLPNNWQIDKDPLNLL